MEIFHYGLTATQPKKKKKLLAEFRKNKIGYRDYWIPISSQRGLLIKKFFI